VNWSQLGSYVGQQFFAASSDNEFLNGYMSNGAGTVVKACSTCNFLPENNAIAANDSLLLTGTGSGGSGPLALSTSPVYGMGAYIQAANLAGATGSFTARIEAFAGFTTVLDTTVTSDANGDPLFLGVSDTSDEVTRVIFSLTDANGNITSGSFVLDKLYLQDSALVQLPQQIQPVQADPEPGVSSLVGSGLLVLLYGLRKRNARA
jgi:hypothetical protein